MHRRGSNSSGQFAGRLLHIAKSGQEHNMPLNAVILNTLMRDLLAEGYGTTMTDDPERTART